MKKSPQVSFRIFTLALLMVAFLSPSVGFAAKELSPLKQKINTMVGREVFIDPDEIPGDILEWKDVERWFNPRGRDALRMHYPKHLEGSGKSLKIAAWVIITPNGEVVNPEIEKLHDVHLTLFAVLHCAGMRFEKPRLDDKPVYVKQKIQLICSEDPEYAK